MTRALALPQARFAAIKALLFGSLAAAVGARRLPDDHIWHRHGHFTHWFAIVDATRREESKGKKARGRRGQGLAPQGGRRNRRPAKTEKLPEAAAPAQGKQVDAKTSPVAAKPEHVEARTHPQERHGLPYILGMLILTLILMAGLIYSIPIMVGLHSPISLLIFGIALWQAWSMNRVA